MSELQDLTVVFDRPSATYAPGETITGKIVFTLLSPANVREIRWKATGLAKTNWTESYRSSDTDGNSSWENSHYGTTEKYFKISDQLVGTNIGDEQTTLAAGNYSYQFTFQLPINIPSSFEHKYGHVRYTVQVIVDRPWRLNRKIDSVLTVASPHNLNGRPGSTPIHDEIEHVVLYFCCLNAGVIRINVTSGESKFLPGEIIELIVNYNSSSTSARVTKMKLELVKQMTFYNSTKSQHRKQQASEVLEKVTVDERFAKPDGTSLKFVLPQLPSLNLEYCTIIEANYELVLSIHFSGMYKKIIRSYPLRL